MITWLKKIKASLSYMQIPQNLEYTRTSHLADFLFNVILNKGSQQDGNCYTEVENYSIMN